MKPLEQIAYEGYCELESKIAYPKWSQLTEHQKIRWKMCVIAVVGTVKDSINDKIIELTKPTTDN